MTQPEDSPDVAAGTDVEVDPQHLDVPDKPASTDPEQLTDDGRLGGTEGQGGAG